MTDLVRVIAVTPVSFVAALETLVLRLRFCRALPRWPRAFLVLPLPPVRGVCHPSVSPRRYGVAAASAAWMHQAQSRSCRVNMSNGAHSPPAMHEGRNTNGNNAGRCVITSFSIASYKNLRSRTHGLVLFYRLRHRIGIRLEHCGACHNANAYMFDVELHSN